MGNKTRILVVIFLLSFLYIAVLNIHPFGYPAHTEMDDYFIRYGQEETGNNNIVASIVFDYRGMDTLGEATVLFTAVIGISLIFGDKNEE